MVVTQTLNISLQALCNVQDLCKANITLNKKSIKFYLLVNAGEHLCAMQNIVIGLFYKALLLLG